jgi:hypothetical protein
VVESRFLYAALSARRLLTFFALGALLLWAKRTWLEPLWGQDAPTIEVRVAPDASESELERARERAVLAVYAIEHGALETDPVVQRRVREDLGASADSSASAELARTLRIDRADPMLRERLAWHGEQLLRARVVVPVPGERELQSYLESHANRYRVPARFSFTHVLISARRGDERERIAKIQTELSRGLSLSAAQALGDASILPRVLDSVTAPELDATFGPGFGDAVTEIAEGSALGPIRSRYGAHFVWMRARSPAQDATLAKVRARVLADYLADARRDATARAVSGLVAHYRIALIREGA